VYVANFDMNGNMDIGNLKKTYTIQKKMTKYCVQ